MKNQQSRKTTLGQRIKALRQLRHLSLRKLAAMADMEHSHLNLIEKGNTSPSVILLLNISDALAVSPEVLVGADYAKSEAVIRLINKITELRNEKKLSAEDLSILMGKNRQYVADIELNRLPFIYSVQDLFDLALIFKCAPAELFDENK